MMQLQNTILEAGTGLSPDTKPSSWISQPPELRSHQPASQSMAAIPSSGSLLATYDYYRRRLDSTFSNSSCGSIECPGEAIPHPPGLPKADPGHWWASLFFGKSTLPFMATVLESAEHPEPPAPGPPGLQQHDHRCSGSGRPESSTASDGPRS
ncbi:pancreatic progenitor cell differentiation and proliferation factor-like isoform X1 [Macaca fascicularis]